MQTYLDGKSGTEHPLPTGCEVLGFLADAFWLKGRFTDEYGWSGSKMTARRYFNGNQDKVSEKTVRAIIEHLVDCFFPQGYFARRVDQENHEIRTTIADTLTRICTGWDIIAGQVNGYRFPTNDPGLAVLPALRLATFDGAIRWGAWLYLRHEPDEPEDNDKLHPLPWWLEDDCVKSVMDTYRSEADSEPTLKDIADEGGFYLDDITNWRAGNHRPKPDHLDFLGQALARFTQDAEPEEITFELRIATGTTYLRRKLEELCGKDRIADLLDGFRLIAQYTCDTLASLDLERERRCSNATAVLIEGPGSKPGTGICHALRSASTGSPFVAGDIAALPHDWTPRLQYWARMLATENAEQATEQLGLFSALGLDAASETIKDIAREFQRRVRDFLAPPHIAAARILQSVDFDPAQLDIGRDGLEQLRPYWLVMQAEGRFSVGDFDGGFQLLQEAVDANPENASFHYFLGGRLGQVACHQNSNQLVERAIHECEIASALDPEWGRPKNEIGVILGNAHRFEEAADAFEAAAPLNEEWHQHHLCRGLNFMWMEEYEAAIECFDRSLELEPNDLRAKEAKGICLLAQGDRRGGKKCLREVARVTGRDLLTDDRWKEVLEGPGTQLRMSHPVRSSTE